MARNLTGAMQTAVNASTIRPLIFFEGEFSTGTINAFSGVGTIEWDGKTWTGGGDLAGVTPAPESDGVEAAGATVSLSGFDSALISLALGSVEQGAPGTLWLGLLDENDDLIADPDLIFSGRLDQPSIEDSGDEASISVTYEDHLIDLERPRIRRYTHADQQSDFPGDLGFEFVERLQNAEVIWGRR